MRPLWKHKYIRRILRSIRDHNFWGLRLEVLFRGFSPDEMFEIEGEIRQIISRRKQNALDNAKLAEIQIVRLESKPFRDEFQGGTDNGGPRTKKR